MVHQQVTRRSRFPMDRAAESASLLAHSNTFHLCGSHEPALVAGERTKWGVSEEIAKCGAQRQTPATLAQKNFGSEKSEPPRTNESDVKAKQQGGEKRHR